MRAKSLPRPARAAATGLAVAVALLAVAVAKADDPVTLRGKAQRLQSANDQLAARSQSALLELYALESRLASSERRLDSLRAEAARLARAQVSARERLRIARHARAEAERQLADRLTVLYIQGEPDPLAVVLGADSLSDAISALDSLNRLAAQDETIIRRVRKTTAELRSSLVELETRRAALRRLISKATAARASLSAARLERTSYLEGLAQARRLNERQLAALVAEADAIDARAQELQADPTAAAASTTSTGSATTAPVSSGQTITVVATGYSLAGQTATGLPVGWGIAAVDPSFIPLGTRMTVPGYGEAVAADTGSAVRGAVIDLWFPTVAQALAWGSRAVVVTVH